MGTGHESEGGRWNRRQIMPKRGGVSGRGSWQILSLASEPNSGLVGSVPAKEPLSLYPNKTFG